MRAAGSRLRRSAGAKDARDGHAAQEAPGDTILRLQRTHGNQAVTRLLARDPPRDRKPPPSTPDPRVGKAKDLAKRLPADRAGVIADLSAMARGDLDALDAVVAVALGRDTKTAAELRRLIRFVRHKPPAAEMKHVFDASGGTVAAGPTDLEGGGQVTVRTGVDLKYTGGERRADGFELIYDGPDAESTRWLQVISREVRSEFDARGSKKASSVPLEKRIDRPAGPYWLTTDPKAKQLNTDTASRKTPFYEEAVNRQGGDKPQVSMADAPDDYRDDARKLLDAPSPPDRVVTQAHMTTYLVRGSEVLYQAKIDQTWTFTKSNLAAIAATPVKPVTTATGAKVKALDAAERARVMYQYAELDYLAGAAIGAPAAAPAFEQVGDLAPAGSIPERDFDPSKKDPRELLADAAALAHAELIDDVKSIAPTSVNLSSPPAAGVKNIEPGLNFAGEFKDAGGETGFVDKDHTYTRAVLPVDRDGPLPRVAIIIGPTVLARGKAYTVATIRHEMTHAQHCKLAIGWLLKWRDERPALDFDPWLDTQRISKLDLALVRGYTGPNRTQDTELESYTEGFLQAFRFFDLTTKPALDLMTPGKFPPPFAALYGARTYAAGWDEEAVKAALQRFHQICCNVFEAPRRKLLRDWLEFLISPSAPTSPPSSSDRTKLDALVHDFAPLQSFLKKALAEVKKCA